MITTTELTTRRERAQAERIEKRKRIADTIHHLGTHSVNRADYDATSEKFLFVDGLLMDWDLPRNARTRDMLENLLAA